MPDQENKSGNLGRRDLLKSLAVLPILGGFFISAAAKYSHDSDIRGSILEELNVKAATPPSTGPMSGDPIRIGIIGFGIRGKQLMRALGFATKDWMENMKANSLENPKDTRYKDFMEQENLNVQLTGVCDAFDVRAEEALQTAEIHGSKAKRYRNYQEMLASPDVDAVVIATPDHWHAPMAIDAIRAGKHVYVEKCMTHKLGETMELYDTVKNSDMVFQVGHQHRQTQSFLTARDLIRKNVLGHISLIQTNTNRNDDNGAWQYEIHEKANLQTIDWAGFLGNAPEIPFNKEHFFRWRKWWAYGTGLSGDLLTHDYDRINCLLEMGIPKSVMASGGIYTHRDGRNVPDVFQVVMEYPDYVSGTSQQEGKEKGMTFVYSATLGNQYHRTSVLMGHDASLEIGNTVTVYVEPRSTRYKDMIEENIISPGTPMYSYNPSAKGVDAVTGATAKYFADKGLLYTYRDGKRVDSTMLHMREWLSGIRNGTKVSCGIEEGFQEAISAHMATLSYRTGRRIEWDPVNRQIVGVDEEMINNTGMA